MEHFEINLRARVSLWFLIIKKIWYLSIKLVSLFRQTGSTGCFGSNSTYLFKRWRHSINYKRNYKIRLRIATFLKLNIFIEFSCFIVLLLTIPFPFPHFWKNQREFHYVLFVEKAFFQCYCASWAVEQLKYGEIPLCRSVSTAVKMIRLATAF